MILLDRNKKALIPINSGVFELSQFKSQKKLNNENVGSLILYPSGEVKRISKISVLGFYGDTVWQKIFSILNTTNRIEIHLDKHDIDIATLKSEIIEYLRNDYCSADPFLPQSRGLDAAIDGIIAAVTFQDLYHSLEVPAEEDCLDVL
ncbi:hypothetical protein [Pseudomonas sp. HMWF032]|uniref:hypothetical protein n=1 Tax=Pseudomonas sp. HMWF032 TaxID=2056866 RepID=UPI0011B216B3|nr:hypothetical protein [Pseudomonas sp. HMWF032]